jgi:hypothetical protein
VLRLIADQFAPGIYAGADAMFSWFWLYAHSRLNALNYPSGVMMRREAIVRAGSFQEHMQTAGDIDYYFKLLEHGSLAVLGDTGCLITLHEGQAHRGTNMDGTAIREHLAVVQAHKGPLESRAVYRRVLDQMHGLALVLGLFRLLRSKTRESGWVHIELARQGDMPWHRLILAAARLVAGRLLWRRLPRVFIRLPAPEPVRPR